MSNFETFQESRPEAIKARYEKVGVGGDTRRFNYDIDILFLNANYTILSAVLVTFEPAGFRVREVSGKTGDYIHW